MNLGGGQAFTAQQLLVATGRRADLAVAVHGQVPVASLRSMIYAYPTFHRAIEDALRDLASR